MPDWLLAAVLTTVLAGPYLMSGAITGMFGPSALGSPLTGLLTAGVTASVGWRRRDPRIMLILAGVCGFALILASPEPPSAVFAVPVITYSAGRYITTELARMAVVLGLFASVIAPLVWRYHYLRYEDGFQTGILVLICAGAVVTPYVLGRRRLDAEIVERNEWADAQERYRMMLAQRQQAARISEVNTRTAIARELHDIVAHSLSVMIVQAEGGKALVGKRPEQAAEALETIAETGRDALSEMRRIVGVLRTGEASGPDYAPPPGLGDISELVERSGDRVSLLEPGPLPVLDPILGLTAYRVVQESVTNFLKHAGSDARAQVSMWVDGPELVVEVADDGLGAHAATDGTGSGLTGMRERVAAVGGYLVAGPAFEGGFTVRARLPLTPSGGPDSGRDDQSGAGGRPVVGSQWIPDADRGRGRHGGGR